MHCDFAFWVGGTRENAGDVGELERLPGAAGIKVFMGSSTGDLLVEDDEGVASILKNTRRRAAFHSEDEYRLRERLGERVAGDPSSHPVWRDEIAALRCTERLVRIARDARARIHVLHISTAEEIVFLEAHKDVATCEVTPHHLTLSADDYARLGTLLQMNPPVRDERHRDGVWRGIAQGVVDVLGSDHAPHTLDEKAKPYPASPSGMTGVQTLVPIMLDHVNAGRLTLERFVDLTSHGPQPHLRHGAQGPHRRRLRRRLHHRRPEARETITNAQAGSQAGWTPYDGMEVTGWPVGTIVRGNRVMWEGEIVTPGQGRPVAFSEALRGLACLVRVDGRRAQSPATKNAQRPSGVDADAVEDVGAEGLHVLVVAGGDDLEQLDALRRRQLVERNGEEIRPDIELVRRAGVEMHVAGAEHLLQDGEDLLALRVAGKSLEKARSDRRRRRRRRAASRRRPSPISGRSFSMSPLLVASSIRSVHAPHRLGQAVEIVDDLGQRPVGLDVGMREILVSSCGFVGAAPSDPDRGW